MINLSIRDLSLNKEQKQETIIFLLVSIIHAFFFISTAFFYTASPIVKTAEKKMIVSTIQLQPLEVHDIITSLPKNEQIHPKKEEIKTPLKTETSVTEPASVPVSTSTPVSAPNPKTPAKEKAPTSAKKIEPLQKKTVTKEKPKPKEQPKPIKEKEPIKEKPKPTPKELPPKKNIEPSVKKNEIAEKNQSKIVPQKNDSTIEKKKALLESARKNIGKIASSTPPSPTETNAKTAVGQVKTLGQLKSLQVDSKIESYENLSPQEKGYSAELASRLKLALRLPEVGEVKIQLKLNRTGKFIQVSILNAQSSNNRKYIEKILPTLTYPSFGNNFGNLQEYTFTISLSNEL